MIISKRGKLQLSEKVLIKIAIVKEKGSFFQNQKKSLFIFLSFISEDLFCENSLIIQYISSKKNKAIILVDTFAIRFAFIDKNFIEFICKKLQIQPQCPTKSKPIYGLDGRAFWLVVHAIYYTLSVQNYIEGPTFLLITRLE